MRTLTISDDIIPVGEFKSGLSKYLRSVQESGHPLVITQNGRPAGVLLSPSDYDELMYRKSFLESVERGICDAQSDKICDTKRLKEKLSLEQAS